MSSRVTLLIFGLSPLARGTLNQQLNTPQGQRFIPAGAGNTATPDAARSTLTVYPRWRGEHTRMRCLNRNSLGLSPLARGTLRTAVEQVAQSRFIPAGAGNTLAHRSVVAENQVYPRWRGEHTNPLPGLMRVLGLSPLARGTPC